MNEFYKGTSAYKLEQYENYTRQTSEANEERKAQNRLAQKALCRLLVAGVMVMFVACSSLIYINVMTLRASTKIDELEKELALVIDENKQKEIEINKNLDMKVIERKAVEELGMQKADNSQVVYINVKKGTHSEAINPKKKSKPVFEGVKERLTGIVEYFN